MGFALLALTLTSVNVARCAYVTHTLSLAARPIENNIEMEHKDKFVNIRFTENEIAQIQMQMNLEGYNSRSRYIRDKVLAGKVQRRDYSNAAPGSSKQMEFLIAEIKRIGNNYNQVVRAVNRSVGLTTKSGNPAVSTKSMEYQLGQLKKMMQDIMNKLSLAFAEDGDRH